MLAFIIIYTSFIIDYMVCVCVCVCVCICIYMKFLRRKNMAQGVKDFRLTKSI